MKLEDFPVIVTFDTEYVAGRITKDRDTLDADELQKLEEEGRNTVLAYSFAVYSPAVGKSVSGVVRAGGWERRHRLNFATFIGRIITKAIDVGAVDKDAFFGAKNSSGRVPIIVAAHFSRADLCSFRDFKDLKKRFDGVRGTFATTTNPYTNAKAQTGTGEAKTNYDKMVVAKKRANVSVTLVDTVLLAPGKARALSVLGDALKFPKLTVPDVTDSTGKIVPGIGRMDLVLKQFPNEFDHYACRDSEVTLRWLLKFGDLLNHWQLDKLPPTLGNTAVTLLRHINTPQAVDAFTGKVQDPASNRPHLIRHPYLAREMSFLANTFHGGRNECFVHGFVGGPLIDIDVKGAYTTAMVGFFEPDWDGLKHSKDLDQITRLGVHMAAAHVKFEFPPDTRFPSLPVSAKPNGLLYPLTGETFATGAELLVAKNQGANIEVLDGIIVPWVSPFGVRPCAEFTKEINAARASFKDADGKDTPQSLMVKEIGNSLYGKTAQSISAFKTVDPDKSNTFNPRKGAYEELPESNISNPMIAAITTGLVRAVVSELLANLPKHTLVVSVTTDGFLSRATLDEAKKAQGPVCAYFSKLRELVDRGNSDILEPKHSIAGQVFAIKTRGTITTITRGGDDYIMARAGYRLEDEYATPRDEARALINLIRTRTGGTTLERRSLIPMPDQWEGETDLVRRTTHVKLNFDWDFKRQPLPEHEALLLQVKPAGYDGGMLHPAPPCDVDGMLRFDTKPWDSVRGMKTTRNHFDLWRKRGNVLKTKHDLDQFERYCSDLEANYSHDRKERYTQYDTPALHRAIRTASGTGVLDWGRTKRPVIAKHLTALGIDTTPKALEMAKVRKSRLPAVTEITDADRALLGELEKLVGGRAMEGFLYQIRVNTALQSEVEYIEITRI